MSYRVKELFYSMQGEGVNAGRPAVFCRFVGCNLWSGKERHRATATCNFCDTDFLGGDNYDEDALIGAVTSLWPGGGKPLCVITGGEPGLQLTVALLRKLRVAGFAVAVETNGIMHLPSGVYHITVSPKAGTEIKQRRGTELKVVWPQDFDLAELETWSFRHRFLQPMDGYVNAMAATIDAVLSNPNWRLSMQTHKLLGLR